MEGQEQKTIHGVDGVNSAGTNSSAAKPITYYSIQEETSQLTFSRISPRPRRLLRSRRRYHEKKKQQQQQKRRERSRAMATSRARARPHLSLLASTYSTPGCWSRAALGIQVRHMTTDHGKGRLWDPSAAARADIYPFLDAWRDQSKFEATRCLWAMVKWSLCSYPSS
jgi:hypothetical protein